MLRFPFIRYSIYCLVLLIMLFFNYFTVGTFFVTSICFVLIEKILSVKKYDKKTENKFIDYGWIILLILTFVIIFLNRDYIVY